MPVTQSSFKQMRMMLVIVLALAGCVMVIYISYVNNQKAYFTDRNLRHLEQVGAQVASKINAYQDMVKTRAVGKEGEKLPGAKTAAESDKQPLSQPEYQYPSVLHADGLQLVRIYDSTSGMAPPQKVCDLPHQFRLKVLEEQSSHWLEIWYHGPDNSQRTVEIGYKVKLEDVIGQFINDSVWIGAKDFDHMLFAVRSNGDVVFQSPGSGFRASSLSAFQGADKVDGKLPTIDLKSIATYTAVHSVLLAGDTYTLFVQPVELSLKDEKCGPDGLVACGLVRADHLRGETNAISPNQLSLILFAIVIAGLGWPFVKLWLMGPKNRLRVRDVVFLGICMVLATGLVTFAVLDVYTYSRLSHEANEQVEELSNRVCEDLRRELNVAVNQLADLTYDDPIVKQHIELLKRQETSAGAQARVYGSWAFPDKASSRERFGGYPYFDTVFWADQDGMQRIKLSAAEIVTPLVKVQDRPYFQQAQKGDVWHTEQGDRGFVAEPVSARDSGKMLAAISMPIEDKTLMPLRDKNARAPWVGVIGTRLLSLSDPVVPDGFGFCVIDRDGKVLFHSDEKRDLQENLFAECDHGADLRSMVSARASGHVDARYLGRGHLLYVRPIQNLPWTLVAFMEERLLAEANFDILIGSVILLLLYCLLITPVCYLLCPLHNKDKSAWIWPDGNRTAAYQLLIWLNLALTAAFLFVIALKNGWALLVPAISIPVIGVVVAYVVVAKRLDLSVARLTTRLRTQSGAWKEEEAASKPGTARGLLGGGKHAALQAGAALGGQRLKFFGYKRLAATAGASTLLLLSALPAMAWFKTVHDRHMRLLVRFEQASMANAAEQRRHSLKGLPRAPRETGRKTSTQWGDYHSLFFNTRLTVTQDESVSEGNQLRSSFESVADRLLPCFGGGLHFSRLVRRLPSDAAGLGTGKDKLEFHRSESVAGTASSTIRLESAVPGLRLPDGLLGWVLGLILLGVLLLVLLYAVRWILKRVFLIDLEERRVVEGKSECECIELRHNLLVLATSPAVNLRADLGLVGVEEIDLAKPAPEQTGQPSDQNGDGRFELQRYGPPHSTAQAIAFRNFDFKLEDADFNKKKLLLLRLLSAAGMKAVVLSAVDPMRFNLGPAPAGEEQHNGHRSKEMELWESTFDSFLKVYVDQVEGLESSVNPEARGFTETSKAGTDFNNDGESVALCLSERLQGTGGKIVRPDVNPSLISYRSIWSNCSQDERLTLCYVARDRFADSRNRALQGLLRRGLVRRDPSLKPMSEAFRQFIISEIKPAEIHLGESEHSHWNVLRTPMMVGLALVVVFLFYTQQNVVSSALALSAALTAVIPAVLRVAGLLQNGKTRGSSAK